MFYLFHYFTDYEKQTELHFGDSGKKSTFLKASHLKTCFLKLFGIYCSKKGSFDELAHVCITIPRDRAIANEERCSQDSSRFITGTRVILIGAFLLYLTGGLSSPDVHPGDLHTHLFPFIIPYSLCMTFDKQASVLDKFTRPNKCVEIRAKTIFSRA